MRALSILKLGAALLVVAVIEPGGLLVSRCASATGSGCSRFNDGAPIEEQQGLPTCDAIGSGCYECAYHHTGDSGYLICSENPDGTGPLNGQPLCSNVAQIPPGWGFGDSGGGGIPGPGAGGIGNPCSSPRFCPAECFSCGPGTKV